MARKREVIACPACGENIYVGPEIPPTLRRLERAAMRWDAIRLRWEATAESSEYMDEMLDAAQTKLERACAAHAAYKEKKRGK